MPSNHNLISSHKSVLESRFPNFTFKRPHFSRLKMSHISRGWMTFASSNSYQLYPQHGNLLIPQCLHIEHCGTISFRYFWGPLPKLPFNVNSSLELLQDTRQPRQFHKSSLSGVIKYFYRCVSSWSCIANRHVQNKHVSPKHQVHFTQAQPPCRSRQGPF